MWPRRSGSRSCSRRPQSEFPEQDASRAILGALLEKELISLDEEVDITFIGCDELPYVGRIHVGTHPQSLEQYMEAPAFAEIGAECKRIGAVSGEEGAVNMLVFWCRDGKSRSVAMAELYAKVTETPAARVVHLCRGLWGHAGCGGCQECDPIRSLRASPATRSFASLVLG